MNSCIEGEIENHHLRALVSTAQALCPHEQSSIWLAEVPYAYCILLLCQATLARASSEFDYLATFSATHQQPVAALPKECAVRDLGKLLFHDTAVDECPSLTVENGIYVCIYGEPARIVFRRAQAHLSEL